MLLRREKWFEYPLRTLDTPAVVADLGLDHLRYPAHIHPQNPVARNGAHRLHAVPNEIDQNLLNLNAIDRDSRKAAFDLDIHADRAPRRLFGHEVAHLGKDAAKRRAASRFQGLPEQGANSAHDVGGTVRITNDALHCSVRSLDIWRLRRKPALAVMRVGNNGGQRLVHLVCDRSRELREARRLARTRKSLLRQTQLFLRPKPRRRCPGRSRSIAQWRLRRFASPRRASLPSDIRHRSAADGASVHTARRGGTQGQLFS